MSATTVRHLRDALDPSPRGRRSESLVVVPANSLPATSNTSNMDVRTVQNWLNRLPDGWNSPQSPDELVIQKRGRRKSIVWSPDLNTYKQRNLLSLSSKDHTPVKSPSTSSMAFRDAARKRLSLDTHRSEFSTPKSKKMSLPSRMSLDVANTPRKRSDDNLINDLRDLSHEQLVQLIMELVHAQEDGTLRENEKFRNILSKKISDADIQPLIKKLIVLKENICANVAMAPILNDDSTYHYYASTSLDAFQKDLVDQGRRLQESHHWVSLMQYVLEAWKITRELIYWESHHNITRKCFSSLSQFCAEAIKRGKFETSILEIYITSLESIVKECEDFQICLQMAKEAKRET